MSETKFNRVSDTDLLFSVGSHRPERGVGIGELISPMTAEELEAAQAQYDEAVAEMMRRDAERGFPYHIPRQKPQR